MGFPLYAKNFLALWWDVVDDPAKPNKAPDPSPPNACALAGKAEYGAPYMKAEFGAEIAERAQYAASPGNTAAGFFGNPLYNPAIIAAIVFDVVEPQVSAANQSHLEMWLTGAVRVIFMSYYIPLPNLDAEGLGKVWDGLDTVSQIVLKDDNFHIAAPMEFRFVKGGNSAMSATFTEKPSQTWFINLDLIGFVENDKMASQYPAKLLQFFADVEREWVKMGGFTHQGKMYGFYDPTAAPGTYSQTGPFNPNFLADLRARRGARLEAFNAYRKSLDPSGLFYSVFVRHLLEGVTQSSTSKDPKETITMPKSASPSLKRQAQRVAVLNNAAVVLSFQVKYKDESGKDGVTASSGNLTYGQKHTIDLADRAGIHPGAKMKPKVAVMTGGDHDGPEIEFAPNDLTAVYTITGTVSSVTVELI